MHSTDWFFLAIVGVTGTIFGSFFSVVVHRLRTGESGFLTGSSHCPLCGHTLSVRDLVPVFSWLASRGHCRYCAGGIPASYLLMEAVSGLSAVLLSWGLSWSYHVPPSMLPTFGEWWWTMGTLFVLFPVAWYDIRHMEIPDEIIRPATTVILLVQLIAWQFDWPLPFFGFFNTGHWALFEGVFTALLILVFFSLQILIPWAWHAIQTRKFRALADLMASLVVFPFWMVSLVGLSRRDSLDNESDAPLPSWMGFGDLRIAVFMGLLGGMWGVLWVMFAYIIGSVFGIAWVASGRSSIIPFGPFLSIGLMLALAFGPAIASQLLS